MDSGRRSSRTARASAPVQAPSQHSSTSSNSSGRAERATRSNPKYDAPRKAHRSTSSSPDPNEATFAIDTTQTRGKRGRGAEREKSSRATAVQSEVSNAAEDVAEDDEAVRCICGFEEYPGPPQLEEDNKDGIKEGIEDTLAASADVTEDLAGFYLQCDVCKVWQHGGCVGIMNEDSSPEEYFCEECRKDLHRIYTAPSGQKYSHYLPLYQSLSATTSRAASFSKDGTRSPRVGKNGRPTSSSQSAKRRSTMNSRDAAYDEEQIRLAIEASREDNGSEALETSVNGTRRGKRGRSDSEENQDAPKRQKTHSRSPSAKPEDVMPQSQAESDDGSTNRATGTKKIRGAAARNHREKEIREEKERQRLEAKQKRMGRAERRRVDEVDTVENTPPAPKAIVQKVTETVIKPPEPPTASEVSTPDTPPILPPTTQKKGGRPPNVQKKKAGKNQYTKDRDQPDKASPHRSQSRDVQKEDNPVSNTKSTTEGRHSKAKNLGTKYTMFDMKRRVNAILEFITRTQLEMAGDAMSVESQRATLLVIGDLASKLPMIKVNGETKNGSSTSTSEAASPSKEFKDLTLMEQIDNLTRQLVKWQKEFT